MKTTINNRAQFISYRSHLVTKTFGKYMMLTFAALGIITLTQLLNPNTVILDDQVTISSLEILEDSKDTQSSMLMEPMNDFK